MERKYLVGTPQVARTTGVCLGIDITSLWKCNGEETTLNSSDDDGGGGGESAA